MPKCPERGRLVVRNSEAYSRASKHICYLCFCRWWKGISPTSDIRGMQVLLRNYFYKLVAVIVWWKETCNIATDVSIEAEASRFILTERISTLALQCHSRLAHSSYLIWLSIIFKKSYEAAPTVRPREIREHDARENSGLSLHRFCRPSRCM